MYATVEPETGDLSPLEQLTDSDLITQARRGNDSALGVLLRRHQNALYRFCCQLTGDPNEAEDVCQEAMARAITRVDRLNASEKFRCWLFSIARNLSIDSHRNRKRLCSLPEDDHAPIQLYGEDVHSTIEVREEHQTVAEALGKLTKSHQNVLIMREVEGLSYAEIARRLDVSQSAVETLLFRARRRLREEYGKTAAPAPAFGLLAGIRGWLSKLAGHYSTAPLVAKLGVSALSFGLMAGAVVSVPRVYTALAHTVSANQALGGSRPASSVRTVSSSLVGQPVRHALSSVATGGNKNRSPGLGASNVLVGKAATGKTTGSAANGASDGSTKGKTNSAASAGGSTIAGAASTGGSAKPGSASGTTRSGGNASSVKGQPNHPGTVSGTAPTVSSSSGSKTGSGQSGKTGVTLPGAGSVSVPTPSTVSQVSTSAQNTASQTVNQTVNTANQASNQAQNLGGQVQTTAQNTVGQAQSTANTAQGSTSKTVVTVTSQGKNTVATVQSKAGSGTKTVTNKVPTPAALPTAVPTLPVPVP